MLRKVWPMLKIENEVSNSYIKSVMLNNEIDVLRDIPYNYMSNECRYKHMCMKKDCCYWHDISEREISQQIREIYRQQIAIAKFAVRLCV